MLHTSVTFGCFGALHLYFGRLIAYPLTRMLSWIACARAQSVTTDARTDSKADRELNALKREVDLLSQLHHDNIVRYIGWQLEDDDEAAVDSDGSKDNGGSVPNRLTRSFFIFLEYAPGGSVASMLEKFGPFTLDVIVRFSRDILAGLAYLHNAGIIHRDVKGECFSVILLARLKLCNGRFSTACPRSCMHMYLWLVLCA